MKPASCLGCPYYDRPGPFWGSGSPEARVAFVTEKPLNEQGGAARTLDNACRKSQINRHREFTTAVVKCEVHHNEFPHWKAIKQCRTLLDQELQSLQFLNTICAVGETPTKEFTGKTLTSVMNRKNPSVWLRGCVYPVSPSISLIPVMAPEFYMRTGFLTAYQLEVDLQKVSRFRNGQGRKYRVITDTNPSPQLVREYVEDIRGYGRGGLDIETPEDADEDELAAGGKPLPIDVIGLASRIGETIGVPPDLYEILRPLFTDPLHPVKWYVFNACFDFYHLGKRFGKLQAVRIFDGMLALNVWRSDLQKKDLGMLMSFFTDMEYTKNLAKIDGKKYQWADTTGILEGGQNIESALQIQGLLRVLEEQDHPLIKDLTGEFPDGLSRMRELGVKTDLREVFKFLRVSQETVAKYEATWNKLFPTVSWSSSQQLQELFCGVLGMPVIMRARTKKNEMGEKTTKKTQTCDADALEVYRDKHGCKTAGLVLAIKEMKHLGDFAAIIRPDTNRIHTNYMIHRQVQRRIQAADPNIQTLPEELADFQTRRMVVPDSDEDEIIAMDASQLELRIYAYISNAIGLLKAMNSGVYIYGAMYEQIFKKAFFNATGPHTKSNKAAYVTVQEILAAKSGPLGFIYNRGWPSLVQKLGMDPGVAKQCHAEFHSSNPEIAEFHKRCDKEVLRLGYQTNLWGARRYFPGGKNQRNEYLSFHGQSNGGELLRSQYLIPAFQSLADFGARVLLTVHDSMAVNTPKRNSQAVAQFLYDHAEAPIPQMNGFVIPCEIKHGPTWADCKLFKTENVGGRTVVLE